MRIVALDTNLLVLLLVGLVGEETIARHRRTRVYDVAAFRLLRESVRQSQRLATTPHILAETSNLIRQCGEPLATTLSKALATFVADADERTDMARLLVVRPQHGRLGLTDTAILELQTGGAVLLTDDNALYLASLAAGHDAINFAHLRDALG